MRFRDFRHTGATMAAQAGAAMCELMDSLGHSTPQAALISQHAASGRQIGIAERLSSMAIDARSRGEEPGSAFGVGFDLSKYSACEILRIIDKSAIGKVGGSCGDLVEGIRNAELLCDKPRAHQAVHDVPEGTARAPSEKR